MKTKYITEVDARISLKSFTLAKDQDYFFYLKLICRSEIRFTICKAQNIIQMLLMNSADKPISYITLFRTFPPVLVYTK